MVCLADRGLFGYDLWKQALETGSELLWRAKHNFRIEAVAELDDGPYLVNVYRRRIKPINLRVIEYTTDESFEDEDRDSFYRLFTSILDPKQAPVSELAALYLQQREIESRFEELKSHLKKSRRILRSQSLELVYQEIWGMLALHYSIRALMCEAAQTAGADLDRLSFVGTLRAIRRSTTASPGFPPKRLANTS